MQAGRLRHRVELQQPTESRDVSGGVTRIWLTIVTRWADIIPLRGQERFDAAKVEAQTNVKFRLRYYQPINQKWRIKWGDRIYNINAIINAGERNFMLEIDAIEVLD